MDEFFVLHADNQHSLQSIGLGQLMPWEDQENY
jgi:hypothetical protein